MVVVVVVIVDELLGGWTNWPLLELVWEEIRWVCDCGCGCGCGCGWGEIKIECGRGAGIGTGGWATGVFEIPILLASMS